MANHATVPKTGESGGYRVITYLGINLGAEAFWKTVWEYENLNSNWQIVGSSGWTSLRVQQVTEATS